MKSTTQRIENIARQERGENALKNKSMFERSEGGITVSSDELHSIMELLNRTPRSTVLQIGATQDLVHVVDKAEGIINKLYELSYGPKDYHTSVDNRLFKIFQNLNDKMDMVIQRVVNVEEQLFASNQQQFSNPIEEKNIEEVKLEDEIIKDDKVIEELKLENNDKITNSLPLDNVENDELKKQSLQEKDEEYDMQHLKGYVFSNDIIIVKNKTGKRFDWQSHNNQEEMLKNIIIQLDEQGFEITNTGKLKVEGWENLMAKYKSIYGTSKGWRNWTTNIIEENMKKEKMKKAQ